MPWPIRYHEKRPDHPEVGDCWPAPWLVEGHNGTPRSFFLSDAFLARWHAGDRRMPLVVRLPGGVGDFCVDGPEWRNGVRGTGGWNVTGTPPNITVQPSINGPGYHGWVTNGIISDDVDGRKLGPDGSPLT
jgi:hypothetical protein